MNTFFTSDTHFGHKNILAYCPNRLDYCADVEDMTEVLIQKWNKKVGPEDRVYHLGDFSFLKNIDDIKSIFKRLNGEKILLKGNHDNMKQMKRLDWSLILRSAIVSFGKIKIGMAHQAEHLPLLSVEPDNAINFGVCGHVHNSWKYVGVGETLVWRNRRLDQNCSLTLNVPVVNVGVDAWGLSPISENGIFAFVRSLENLPKREQHEQSGTTS